MNRLAAIIVLSLISSPALAQQPQQQSPAEVALQINSIITQFAQGLTALQQQNAKLQADLAAMTKERDDLKTKQESGK